MPRQGSTAAPAASTVVASQEWDPTRADAGDRSGVTVPSSRSLASPNQSGQRPTGLGTAPT
jgi:hypothetical protein